MTDEQNNAQPEETTTPATEEATVDQPVAEQPAEESPAVATEEATADEPVAEESSAQETVEETLKSWWDEVEVAGHDAVEYIRDLIEKGNIRHILLVNDKDETLLEIPLAAGVMVGAGAVVIAPILAAVGVAVALLAKIRIRIERIDVAEEATTEAAAEEATTEENNDSQA